MKPETKTSIKTYLKPQGRISGTLLLAGFALFVGFIWGQAYGPAGPNNEPENKLQNYSAPVVPVGEYNEIISVDIIRNNSDIWVVDHYTGALIFEYNRFKPADKEAWQEYEDLLGEVQNY